MRHRFGSLNKMSQWPRRLFADAYREQRPDEEHEVDERCEWVSRKTNEQSGSDPPGQQGPARLECELDSTRPATRVRDRRGDMVGVTAGNATGSDDNVNFGTGVEQRLGEFTFMIAQQP